MKYSYGSKLVRHLFVIYTDFIRDAIRMANGCGNNQKNPFYYWFKQMYTLWFCNVI